MVYAGLQRTPAVNAILMNSAIPLFVIVCAWILDGDRPRAVQVIGIAVSFLGIAAIVARGSLAELFALRLNLGDLLILAAMPVWGVYTVLFRRRPPGIAPMTLIFIFSAAGTAVNLPLHLIEGANRTGVFVHLMPAFGTLMAMLFLDENPRWFHGFAIPPYSAASGSPRAAAKARSSSRHRQARRPPAGAPSIARNRRGDSCG